MRKTVLEQTFSNDDELDKTKISKWQQCYLFLTDSDKFIMTTCNKEN